MVLFVYTFKTGCKVYIVTHHSVVLFVFRTHITGNHFTRVQTNTGKDWTLVCNHNLKGIIKILLHIFRFVPGSNLFDVFIHFNFRLLHFDCCCTGTFCMIFHFNWSSNQRNNSISFVLIYRSAFFHNKVRHFCKVEVQEGYKLSGIKKFAEAWEFLNISKHGSHFNTFTTKLERRRICNNFINYFLWKTLAEGTCNKLFVFWCTDKVYNSNCNKGNCQRDCRNCNSYINLGNHIEEKQKDDSRTFE